MNIRKLHHIYRKLEPVKPWYFLVVAGIFALLAVYGLRNNYSTMVKLREAVYVADQQNGDVEKALKDLREHVHSHMNTNLASGKNAIRPPIQLKARYERLQKIEQDNIKAQNVQVQTQAEQICGGRFPGEGFNAPRVACVQEYVAANAVKPRATPDQLYKFDFVSPRWSPDLAGVSILLSALFVFLYVASQILERWVRRRLRN